METDLHFDLPLEFACPAVVLCLMLGAYMSAAETAITGASRPRMHRLAQQGNKRAALINGLLDRKDEAVSAVLLGNSVVNILSASLTTAVLTAIFGAADPGAVDRRDLGDPGAAGARRRLGLAPVPEADRRACRPQAGGRRTCRPPARRHRTAWRRPDRRRRPRRKGDAALGARSR
jgi:hypothetical protein